MTKLYVNDEITLFDGTCTLQKGVWLLLEQLQKVIKHPSEQMACGIRELHATTIMLAIYRWEN